MRESIKQLLGILTESVPFPEPIVEFGSFQVPGQEGFADLRPLFPDKIYIGSDVREGPGVDRILDLHDIDLPSDSVGTALIIDTLEHVEFPRRALEEVHRVLRPGGMVVVTSVMNFQVHDYPHDYWRFTPEGLRSLLKPFTSTLVDHAGDDSFPHTVIGLGFKGAAPHLGPLAARIGAWKRGQPAWPPVSISPEARASRSRRRRWAGAAALAGLLALSYYLASAGLLAGLLACAALAAGLSYLLGYRLASRRWQTEKYRRRRLGVGALVLVGLALLLPYLSPRGRTAFPLWYLSLTCAASVVAHAVGRLWGRRKRRRRDQQVVSPHTPHSAAIPAQGSDLKRAIVDSFCELYFGSGAFRDTFWLGVPAVKCPLDMWIYQEIINEVRPDVIIETGTAHGGSALFLACICDLVGNGRVVTIDTEASEARPHHPRLTYLTGSSTSGEVVAEVSRLIGDGDRVMVVLDSDHSRDHVMAELAIYSRLVTEGSYLIVEDSVIGHPVFPELSPGPMEAVMEFLSEANEFVADRSREKFHLTFNPRGYLKRTGKLAP